MHHRVTQAVEGWRWERGVAHQHVLGVAQDRVREQDAEEHRGQRNQLLHLLLGRHHRRDARLEAHRRRLVRHCGELSLHSDDAHGCIRLTLRGQKRPSLLH